MVAQLLIVTTLVFGMCLSVEPCAAQHGTGLIGLSPTGFVVYPELPSLPLTVQPNTLPLATRTERAGEFPLDSLKDFFVYVPPQCVGTQRCPLVVFLHPGDETSRDVLNYWRPVADAYGQILLAPQSSDNWQKDDERTDQQQLDAALGQVFTKFTIDLKRVALVGYSASGGGVIALGGDRLDLFSRIILGDTDFSIQNVDPHNTETQFLVVKGSGGYVELNDQVTALRQTGHPTQALIALRTHTPYACDWDVMGHWLQTSWAIPNPAARPKPQVTAKTLPLLTPAIVAKMLTFWHRFLAEPDSIKFAAARLLKLREVVIPVGPDRPTTFMADIPALAAKYPSVAADLQAAGLTAEQHEVYRVALLSAYSGIPRSRPTVMPHLPNMPSAVSLSIDSVYFKLKQWEFDHSHDVPLAIDPTSVQGQNVAFVLAHSDILQPLESEKYYNLMILP